MTCFVSRPSGITLVKFHSLQVTIKTNLLAELTYCCEIGFSSYCTEHQVQGYRAPISIRPQHAKNVIVLLAICRQVPRKLWFLKKAACLTACLQNETSARFKNENKLLTYVRSFVFWVLVGMVEYFTPQVQPKTTGASGIRCASGTGGTCEIVWLLKKATCLPACFRNKHQLGLRMNINLLRKIVRVVG